MELYTMATRIRRMQVNYYYVRTALWELMNFIRMTSEFIYPSAFNKFLNIVEFSRCNYEQF